MQNRSFALQNNINVNIMYNSTQRSSKKGLICASLLLASTLAFAQGNKVTGTVKDANGIPLIGVNVVEVGTNNGTVTDIDGNYTLEVKPNAKLMFS